MKNTEPQMPGAWICDKCGFVLQKNVLHTMDGSISANTADHCEGCPNDGLAMRPLTWREVNEDLFKRATEEIAKRQELERQNAAMREAIEKSYPTLLSSNANSLAYHASQGEPFCGVGNLALAAWLNEVERRGAMLKSALQPDAGRDFIPREKVML